MIVSHDVYFLNEFNTVAIASEEELNNFFSDDLADEDDNEDTTTYLYDLVQSYNKNNYDAQGETVIETVSADNQEDLPNESISSNRSIENVFSLIK